MLEKIDIIRERSGAGYRKAKEVLDKAGGDLLTALVLLEEEAKGQNWTSSIKGKGEELLTTVKEFVEQGTSTRLRLKKDGRVLFEVPAGAGVLGLAGMLLSGELAVLGAVGTVTAMLNRCTLEIEHKGEKKADSELQEAATGKERTAAADNDADL